MFATRRRGSTRAGGWMENDNGLARHIDGPEMILHPTDTPDERADKALRILNGNWNRHKLAEVFERYMELDGARRPTPEEKLDAARDSALSILDAGQEKRDATQEKTNA